METVTSKVRDCRSAIWFRALLTLPNIHAWFQPTTPSEALRRLLNELDQLPPNAG